MTDARREEGTKMDPTLMGVCEVVEEKISETQTETILSRGIHILSRDTSAPTHMAGWGPDTEGHVGRIKPYSLK